MTVITGKNIHAQASGFFTALVGLQAFVTACGPTISGADTLAARPAAAAATTAQNPLSDTDQLADITLAQLDAMQLPAAKWNDDGTIVQALHNKFYNQYCPNFDIDKNGRVESIKTEEKDRHGTPVFKGDYGILTKALGSINVKAGWPQDLETLNAPGAQISSQFKSRYPSLSEGWYHIGYLNCLQRARSFDVNADKVAADMGDIMAIAQGILNIGPKYAGKSQAEFLAREKLNSNLRVCYVYFKFNNETKPRVMQQSCAIGANATFRRLPDLTSEKTVVNSTTTSCKYKSGTNTIKTLTTTNKDSSTTQCGDGLGGTYY